MYKILISNNKNIENITISNKNLKPFDEILTDFVNEVSNFILKTDYLKAYPEIIALGFWLRKANITKLKKHFFKISTDKILIPRGIVFHIAPSNVDTIFAYSWFISLLVGNSNIIRISDKENIQTNILLEIIIKILEKKEFKIIKEKTLIIKYGHNDEITKKLSELADVRVIWGGDETINHIRKIPIKPNSIELTFADKFSFSIIKSNEFNKLDNLNKFIHNFYNDSFWFNQMACSSTKLIVWIGNKNENKKAKEKFWKYFSEYVLEKKPNITSEDIINKFVSEISMAIENKIKINQINPYIHTITISSFKDINEKLHTGNGLFYELEENNLRNILKYVTKKHQTITYFGFTQKELKEIIMEILPNGIDRIVPIGKALEFSYIWDGYDLLQNFCRELSIL